ncbi:ParB N-terminal domain-containing protein [Actinocrinis puniceicyclus]|uniref:ParB N-terminal domain-containing protein n=1 Tax=Actinocrinis puniceicyclus TaxID=977794 RepID=A0A8J7WU12_9ACTN|nr:ParB N-terminal domain-containing protein [Actinocrinis puniceicyclus]MBS2966134.1 ParB N-terminal domain-containing protein [Actinocrinis puniceicyclus]
MLDVLLSDSDRSTSAQRPAPTTFLPLELLRTGESPRSDGIDREYVGMLAAVEVRLPPILVHRGTMRVIDGVHRLHAARLAGASTIEVEFFDGTDREVFVKAVEANIANGLPLSLRDRKNCAARIIRSYPEWSDRLIAAKTGLATKTVAALRADSCADVDQSGMRVGADGRLRPVNVAAGRLRAGEVLERNPEASLREIARQAGISVGTARDVRERLLQGRSLLPGDGDRAEVARSATDPTPHPRPESVNLVNVLESLRRDPALRYSEDGRTLIRWLDARIIRTEEAGYATRVPPHQAAVIAKAARACAQLWENIAQGLERRAAVENP